jgi:hypothetical protein
LAEGGAVFSHDSNVAAVTGTTEMLVLRFLSRKKEEGMFMTLSSSFSGKK